MNADPESVASRLMPAHQDERLGIKHLLIWTALCGVWLAWFRATNSGRADSFGNGDGVFWPVMMVLQSLSGGAALGFPLLWWMRRGASRRFPVYPGEWLWLVRSLQHLIGMGMATAFALGPPVSYGTINWHSTVQGGAFTFALLLDIVGLLHVKAPWRWRIYMWSRLLVDVIHFGMLAGTMIFQLRLGAAPAWWFGWSHYISIVVAALVLIVALFDWRARERFPWTHWMGIGIAGWEIPINLWIKFAY